MQLKSRIDQPDCRQAGGEAGTESRDSFRLKFDGILLFLKSNPSPLNFQNNSKNAVPQCLSVQLHPNNYIIETMLNFETFTLLTLNRLA